MKLEQQVTSLELSKRMKELGLKIDKPLFYYARYGVTGIVPVYRNQLILDDVNLNDCIPAYTVAELGEMLPKGCATFNSEYQNTWKCSLSAEFVKNVRDYQDLDADNEADARAKMLIYLKENNLI